MTHGNFPPDVEELPSDHDLYLALVDLEDEFEEEDISEAQFLYGLKEYADAQLTERHFEEIVAFISEWETRTDDEV